MWGTKEKYDLSSPTPSSTNQGVEEQIWGRMRPLLKNRHRWVHGRCLMSLIPSVQQDVLVKNHQTPGLYPKMLCCFLVSVRRVTTP